MASTAILRSGGLVTRRLGTRSLASGAKGFVPFGDRILVQKTEAESKSAGGIILPDAAKEKVNSAKVLAVGAGKRDKDGKLLAMDTAAGDTVIVPKYGGTDLKLEGDECLIYRNDDIVARSNASEEHAFKGVLPLGDRILVEKAKAEEKSAGGILLPDAAKEQINHAKVLSVGSGKRDKDGNLIPMDAAVGDTVIIPKYGGSDLKIEGDEYHIYRNDEIVARSMATEEPAFKGVLPLGDRILVQKSKADEKSAGGILLPDAAKEETNQAKVLAAGAGKRGSDGNMIPMDTAAGDTVVIPKWGGSELKLDGEEYHLFRNEDIVGVFRAE